ncbi:MAG: winged helix-turn-helix transcriptional regulator [Chromatiales bacterium]|jgi:MarR family transcriptional regulator, organic hydroperoxide resistance regulator|nr:winged helix-turn-helix transcriptional regulator [Chromatiales bacterium]
MRTRLRVTIVHRAPDVYTLAMTKDGSDVTEAFIYEPGRSLGYLLRDGFRAFNKVLHDLIEAHGVAIGHWYFLRELWVEDGLTQRELSRRAGIMEPTTAAAVNAMEEKGLISRERNADDRRKVNIFLTQVGRQIQDELLPYVKQVNELAATDLSPGEMAELRQLLDRVRNNLVASGVDEAGELQFYPPAAARPRG